MSASTAPTGSGGRGSARPPTPARTFRPARAAVVIVLSVGVGAAVLARMSGPRSLASATTTTTAQSAPTTATTSARTTTVPSTTTTTLAPAKVTVLVLNGGNTYHAALYFQTKLSAAGYDTLAPSNATTSTNKLSQIFVVAPTARANALAIAQILRASPSSVMAPTSTNDSAVPPSLLSAADVIVVVGADISGQVPANFNTSTTAAATTTTALTTTTAAATTTSIAG